MGTLRSCPKTTVPGKPLNGLECSQEELTPGAAHGRFGGRCGSHQDQGPGVLPAGSRRYSFLFCVYVSGVGGRGALHGLFPVPGKARLRSKPKPRARRTKHTRNSTGQGDRRSDKGTCARWPTLDATLHKAATALLLRTNPADTCPLYLCLTSQQYHR